jgi:carbamoyltransferase
MEWGPRALGNRSILADPTQENIKEILNSIIKKRELFRPFAPMILEDYAKDYFYMNGHNSKFMNIVFKARNITKKKFPCVVHHDNTSRVQTVNSIDNKKIFDLISNFYKISGSPILINTSLNIQGPIAMSPMDAFKFFKESNVKTLILNNWIIENKN